MNLVVNAKDAMPDGGEITIQTVLVEIGDDHQPEKPDIDPGQYVVISVCDTGVGMNQQTVENIFEPFFTTKDLGKGTGLGLSTVYGIVRQHAGDVFVASSPGLGTTVTLYLPPFTETPPAS